MLAVLDTTVQGILFLIAVILFVLAAVVSYSGGEQRPLLWPSLVAFGLACATFVFMWNAFDA